MNVLYIANLKVNVKGGLFKATIERLSRMEKRIDETFVINNNFYDSAFVRFVKSRLKVKDNLSEEPKETSYKNVKINNSNYKRTVLFYLKRLLHLKSTENGLVRHYLKHYKEQLESADIIHAQWGWTDGYIAHQLSQKLNKPYFVTLHGSDVNKVWKHNVDRLVEAMEKAETCFFVSGQLLEEAKALGYSGENALVTYNGVDTKAFNKLKRQHNNRVGYIGSLKKIKGADLLPEIFDRIHRDNKEVAFTVIGDGELRADLENAFDQLDIDCEMLGAVDYDEVPEILGTIDVLVVPSRNEGLGMVILEANAMGIPVVGTNVGGIPEAIGFEENIIAFDDKLTQTLSKRVNELLTTEADTEKYRERVRNEFDWDKIVSLEFNEYEKALSKRHG